VPLGFRTVIFKGHIVAHEGVKVDPKKIKSMREWTIPKTLNKIRVFLGLKSNYRNFERNYGQIATPIKTLLKKEKFSWTQEVTKYFEKPREAMCTTHVLAILDYTKTFIMEFDYLGNEIGAILMQEGRSLAFERNQLKGKNLLNPFMKNILHILPNNMCL
jgi:hypothetical protein